ncbi:hypothetical protein SELMODRAFT_125068, partial [Selaginella moellendorffii]
PVPLLPPEIHDDDIEISDEDVEFVTKNKGYAGFLSGLDTKGITKQVLGLKPDWNGDNLERFYEKKAKVAANKDFDNALTVDPVDALPIKNPDGTLEYRRVEKAKAVPSPEKKQDADEKEQPTKTKQKGQDKSIKAKKESKPRAKGAEVEPDVKKPALQPEVLEELQEFVSVEEKRGHMKEKIANLSTELLSCPEDSTGSLKELISICSDKDDTVKHFAMLSLMAIFRDILPGYRIRPPTEKELEMKVSKEVKQTRDYEATLLKCYQGYVQTLIRGSYTASGRHIALKCMCGLLEAVPHFNFGDNLLRAVVPFLDASDPAERYVTLASLALCSLFKNERKHGGEATVEAVQLIADYVKESDCNVQPDVLQASVFLALTFDENIVNKNEKALHKPKSKFKREDKKEKRNTSADDIRKEVAYDFREASTLPDAKERRKLQTATLSAVFETYFRVLKAAVAPSTATDSSSSLCSHPLLGTCLQGLLKFSHLISVDFLGDLLAVLRKLAEGKSSVEERLQCCVAAFRIMKANLDALTVDLKEFYVHFYDVLLHLYPDRNLDSENSFAEALQVILCESRHHDLQRVAAFVKRLAAVSFHFGSSTAMAALVTIRHLLLRYKKCRNLLENDGGGGNAMLPFLFYKPTSFQVFHLTEPDPDLSGALSSVLWELALLQSHYNPEVAKLSQQIAGTLASENFSVVMSPKDATAAYSIQQGGFRPAVKLPPSKLVKKSSYKSRQAPSSLPDAVEDSENAVDFRDYFRLLRDITENQALRKELVKSKTMVEMYARYKSEKRIAAAGKKSKTKGPRKINKKIKA